jgi:WD40 repeat protein
LHVYDAKGTEKWKEQLPPAAVGGCCFFADGATLALATKGEVKLFAVATGKVTSTLKVGDVAAGSDVNHESDWTADLVISADGKWLAATIGQDGDSVFCWDVKAGKVQHRLKSGKPVGFTHDASELFTYKGTTVTCWTLASGAAARTIEISHDRDLALSPDSKILASSAGDAVILIDAATGKHLAHSADPPGLPTTLRFNRADQLVGLLAGWGGWVEWDVPAGTSRLLRPPGVGGFSPVALSIDGRVAFYRKEDDYSTRDMATGKTLVTAKQAENVNGSIVVAGMTADGQAIIAPVAEGLAVTTAKGRTVIRNGRGEMDGNVSSIATSADGRWAAIAFRNSEEHPIDLYDLHAGQFARRLSAKGDVSQLTFAPDGHWLAAAQDIEWRQPPGGNDQRAVTVFDPHTGRAVLQITLEAYHEAVIALSAGGRMLARLEGTRDSEYKIAIWEVLGNSVRARYDIGGTLSALAFAPDGRTLAASIYGGPVFLWDLHAPPKDTAPPTATDLDRAWTDLRAADAAKAFEAIKLLARNPAAAVPLLREKITPVAPPDPAQVRRLIDDLDHKDYRRRETAMRGLADLGERVRAPLKQALTPGQTPEVRERIERLLAAEERPTPDYLRRVRAVEAVEVAGTKEARELLGYWAGGAPGALFTRDAEAAMKRLAVRKEN